MNMQMARGKVLKHALKEEFREDQCLKLHLLIVYTAYIHKQSQLNLHVNAICMEFGLFYLLHGGNETGIGIQPLHRLLLPYWYLV